MLTTENFMGIVMDPHMDVLLVLQAHDSADSQARAYYGNDIWESSVISILR